MAKQSGFLMLVIALLLVVIAGLAVAFVSMIFVGTSSSISIISANYAYDLAQTGIENGNYQLSLGTCSSSWSSIVTVTGQGEYQYNCTKNTALTTTTSALSTLSTSIPLASAANFATFGAISIDSEMIYYDGISGNTLQNARRGQNGTAAATHALGASVSQAQYIISSQGGAPSLSSPNGEVTLTQAVLLSSGANYYAVGTQGTTGVILNYNGSSWSTALTAENRFTFRGIDMSATFGLAVGSNTSHVSSIYQFNGSSWSLLGTVNNADFQEVSCDLPNSPTLCWIVGQARAPQWPLMYYTGTGATYIANNLGNTPLYGVCCISDQCFALAQNDLFSFPVTSTAPFSNRTNIGGTLNGIDCAQSNSCVLVRSVGAVHYYNGYSWNTFYISGQSLNAVHCPSTMMCVVVGNNGVIFNCSLPMTSASSCVAQSSPGTLNLLAVHCNATNDCLAVGAGTLAYRYTGSTWTAISLPANYTLNSVSGTSGTGTGSAVTPTVWHNQ